MALKKYLRRHRRRYRSLPPLPSTDEIEEAASKTPFGKAGGTIRSYLSLPFTMEDFSVRKSILSATEEAFFRTRTLWEEFMVSQPTITVSHPLNLGRNLSIKAMH
jgi:hypothetical protein